MTASVDGTRAAESEEYGPWNPGIVAQVPLPLLPLATIFRAEHVFGSVEYVTEMQDFIGIDKIELVAFRPQRLVLHELLIRVMADLSVNSGTRIEDLGINFRRMTDVILAAYIEPHMEALVGGYEHVRAELQRLIDGELGSVFDPPAWSATTSGGAAGGGFFDLFRRARTDHAAPQAQPFPRDEYQLAAQWEREAHVCHDGLHRAAYRALARVATALLARRSRLLGGRELIAKLAVDLACNDYGSEELGRLIEPYIAQACQREGFTVLCAQPHPLVMNTKGASASGKSTMRPLQEALANRIGVDWRDFALISPDVWRKRLLDYDTLGPHYKYAGAFAADEIHIIDRKLDRHMARKAERGGMTHLLIDRFRFDSFAPESDEAGSNLLTRFGHVLYLFFMITPPESTVERSWQRGLQFGRYKAVDDLLAHNVEAYSGMPELFFTWARRDDKRVHYEFLDNSVPLGERPRTVAFGWNDELNVLDVKRMIDVARYRKLSIQATSPEALYSDRSEIAPERCTDFLRQCARELTAVNFADQASGRVYLRLESGQPVWVDIAQVQLACTDADTRAGLLAVAPRLLDGALATATERKILRHGAEVPTLGRWGEASSDEMRHT